MGVATMAPWGTLLLLLGHVSCSSPPDSDPERDIPQMTVPQLIRYWGYPVEEHWVTTGDGYILGLHRIPHGLSSSSPRGVVYLQHCLTCSSAVWAFGPPSKSLGFLLADAGYDVWMGNSRGNSYSRNHTTLEPCSFDRCKDFWLGVDWDEGGLQDLTTGIDYALSVTGERSLYFGGHSMGCTQYLVMLSSLPEYNDKIRLGVLLAPPAYMSTHTTSSSSWHSGPGTSRSCTTCSGCTSSCPTATSSPGWATSSAVTTTPCSRPSV